MQLAKGLGLVSRCANSFSTRRGVRKNTKKSLKGCWLAATSCVEQLETRRLMTGTWTQVTAGAPSTLGTMMLMTDGSVMVQKGGVSNGWLKLTPDATGSYVNGTWSTLASMSLQRLYTAGQVLPDGRVWILGGEYSGPSGASNWTNTGEIYNPVSNTWTSITNYPATQFGDVPTQLLPDGRILAGNLSNATTNIYNLTTNIWTPGPTKLSGDRSDEETWIRLADNSILSYDIFAQPNAQRYKPTTNSWVAAGVAPASMGTPSGAELGPGFLLPDGRALQIGGTSKNAIYNPATNTWVAAADTPGGLGANDAPGAMLPNGKILIAVGDTSTSFNPPTLLYEYDYVSNTFTAAPVPVSLSSSSAYTTRMLMLPTGQVLFNKGSSLAYIYTPDGAPQASWRPAVSNITNNGDNTFTLTGTQINGMSEGAVYGDDAAMSSNYPIVKLTSLGGAVKYAKTYGWSVAVQGGATPMTTQFSLPSGFAASAYLLSVSGAGISTANNTLHIEMGAATTSSVTLRVDPGNASNVQILAGASVMGSVPLTSFSNVVISGDGAGDTVRLGAVLAGKSVVVNGGAGADTVILESALLSPTLTLNLGATDTVNYQIDTFVVTSNLGTINAGLSVGVSNGATVSFAGAQSFATLTSTAGTKVTEAASMNLNGASTIAGVLSLVLGGSLIGGSDLVVSSGGSLIWSGGSMGGTGKTTLASGATGSLTSSGPSLARELAVGGIFTLGTGTLNVEGAAGVLKVVSTGTLQINGTSGIGFSSSAGSILNQGIIAKTGATSSVTVPITNTGTVNVVSGTLSIESSYLQTAGTTALSGGLIAIVGALPIAGGAFVGNSDGQGLSLTLSAAGRAIFNTGQHLGTVTLTGSSVATSANGAHLLSFDALSIGSNATMDLLTSDLILHNGDLATIRSYIANWWNNGLRTGTGLATSALLNLVPNAAFTTLGVVSNALTPGVPYYSSFDTVPVVSTDLLIKYTYYGDTDLSGGLDGSDAGHIIQGLSTGLTGWNNGDVDYSGDVTAVDYALFNSALVAGVPQLAVPSGRSSGGGALSSVAKGVFPGAVKRGGGASTAALARGGAASPSPVFSVTPVDSESAVKAVFGPLQPILATRTELLS